MHQKGLKKKHRPCIKGILGKQAEEADTGITTFRGQDGKMVIMVVRREKGKY